MFICENDMTIRTRHNIQYKKDMTITVHTVFLFFPTVVYSRVATYLPLVLNVYESGGSRTVSQSLVEVTRVTWENCT